MASLDTFFRPRRVAVIGASRTPGKVGNVILSNLIRLGFKGDIYPINPNADYLLERKCYPSLKHVPRTPDLAIIATPPDTVLEVADECGKAGIGHLIIVTAGFKEIGKPELEERLREIVHRHKMRVIGPNCLGVYDSHSRVDSLLLPSDRLQRPQPGGIAFITQSGALGSAIMDLAAAEGMGFSKFISYGNAIDINESDLIEYLADDRETQVICAYIEGVKDGRRFLEAAKRATKKKPLIVIKGGMTEAGGQAALSHTGALAGSAKVYLGAFRQAGITVAETISDMMDCLRIFEKVRAKPRGRRVQIITNGGGYGIIAADACHKKGLQLAEMSERERSWLRAYVPPIAILKNPIDLLGDATNDEYDKAIEAAMRDPNIDIVFVIVLMQTPRVDEPAILREIVAHNQTGRKPIVVVTTGSVVGEELIKHLEQQGVPAYRFPESAAGAIRAFVDFHRK